jgi:hypothetical protein
VARMAYLTARAIRPLLRPRRVPVSALRLSVALTEQRYPTDALRRSRNYRSSVAQVQVGQPTRLDPRERVMLTLGGCKIIKSCSSR